MTTLVKTQSRIKALSQPLFMVSMATIFLGICSHFKFYLPSVPVAMTMHTFAILVIGSLLPLKYSLPTFLIYFVEALIGSPILGVSLSLFGPSIGYFFGMIVSLCFMDQVLHKRSWPLLPTMIIANVLFIWGFGILHLQTLIGWKSAIMLGLLPYIAGDAFKLCAAYSLVKFSKRKLERTAI